MTTGRTIETVRKKIDQNRDASDEGDLIHRNGVASGWIACLRLQGLIDEHTFMELTSEQNQIAEEVQAAVASGT
ncbi:hypothetical protein QP835_11380 [Pseudomonas oryzihabitans]|uniref:hypothetical protein n=1 Tax=Pseudomonas oryzihabitans TaxID=47885 RepID=UPI0025522372|nr:hypothetical protein [Pseudomonas oryzihabitans]MDK8264878.1 hypothetical protein [Pseudomonas oryzihabitans]